MDSRQMVCYRGLVAKQVDAESVEELVDKMDAEECRVEIRELAMGYLGSLCLRVSREELQWARASDADVTSGQVVVWSNGDTPLAVSEAVRVLVESGTEVFSVGNVTRVNLGDDWRIQFVATSGDERLGSDG